MKNTINILLIFCIIILNKIPMHSQNSFEFFYGSKDWAETPSDIEEDQFGNIYLTGIMQQKYIENKCGFILKINSDGVILIEYSECHPDSSFQFSHIIFLNDSIFVFGDKGSVTRDNQNIFYYLQFDQDLNMVNRSEFIAPPDILDISIQSVSLLNSHFIILLNSKPLIDPVYPDIGFFKLNKNLDSIACVIDHQYGSQVAYDFIAQPDGTGFNVFAQGYYPDSYPGYSELVSYDSSFNYIDVDSVPYHIYNQFSCRQFDDSSYLLSGKKGLTNPTKFDVGIIKSSYLNQTLSSNHFGKGGDTSNYAGVLHNVDFIDNNSIYLGGTSNFIWQEYPWQISDSWIMLNNLDTNLNLNWQMFYGGDAFYHLRGLKATQDGGCIMYATRFDENTQDEEYDIYILKVDSSGLMTSISEGFNVPVQQLAIIPNPASDIVSIRYPDIFGYDEKEINVYNSLGFPILNASATQNITEIILDVASLPSGIYFVILKVEGKKVATGKMVKR